MRQTCRNQSRLAPSLSFDLPRTYIHTHKHRDIENDTILMVRHLLALALAQIFEYLLRGRMKSTTTYFSLAWASEGTVDPLPLAYIMSIFVVFTSLRARVASLAHKHHSRRRTKNELFGVAPNLSRDCLSYEHFCSTKTEISDTIHRCTHSHTYTHIHTHTRTHTHRPPSLDWMEVSRATPHTF